MIVLCRFESGRYRSFRNTPHPLSDVLCGLTYAVGRKAFLLSPPGRFVDDFTILVDLAGPKIRLGELLAERT